MAIRTTIVCSCCGQSAEVTRGLRHSGPELCDKCSTEQEKLKEWEHFRALDAMSLENRVRRLEMGEYCMSRDMRKIIDG